MRPPRVLALLPIALAGAGLAGCASVPAAAPAHVVVRVAPSADPAGLEVHVAAEHGGHRTVRRMRPGQTRDFTEPAGWVTVRVAGLCVVPARTSGTAVVEVGRDGCRLV